MTSIDQVIARSRQPGEFSERKRFTVARRRGIEKMRRFALADPHFYILELIQSSIAAGAEYINIEVDDDNCTLSYIGGGLKKDELAQLFDFLFASKDRTDLGYIRELALGVNAALLFEPTQVVVESGDGTLEGTTRIELRGDQDEVVVGRPTRPLAGTYVALSGLKRKQLPGGWHRSAGHDPPREVGVIESRCLSAPIPILVNGAPLFGFSKQRTPGLFGYRAALAFDEGDLFGTIGIDPNVGNSSFRLLKWGVWIQTKEHELLGGAEIGGIVCFDALRKTVDHSGIVEDERLHEMWARVEPYARALKSGQRKATPFEAHELTGGRLGPTELRRVLAEFDRIVLVPQTTTLDSEPGRRAIAIGNALEAPVLVAANRQANTLRRLARGQARVIQPEVSSDRELEFYTEPRARPPARPWLCSAIEVAPMPLMAAAQAMLGDADPKAAAQLTYALGGEGEVTATVYTPAHGSHRAGLTVRVVTMDRTVWEGEVASAHPGHVLVVRVPESSPLPWMASLLADEADPVSRAEALSHVMAVHAAPTLGQAFDRALVGLDPERLQPGSGATQLALAAVGRNVVLRLRRDEHGQPDVRPCQLGATQIDLPSLPMFTMVDGSRSNLDQLADLMRSTHGMVYATIPSVEADLEGLRTDRILQLDAAEEDAVLALVGDGSYVRLDERDVLAEFRGVTCRDLAIGLREYPEFPLLIEGVDPSGWDDETRAATVKALVVRLVRRFLGEDPPRPDDWVVESLWEECRRQACRHLQWYVCRLAEDAPDYGVRDLPLFLDAAGDPHSFRQVRAALQSPKGLVLYYSHALGGAELGRLVNAGARNWKADPQQPPPTTLAGDPFLFELLDRHGDLLLAFDFDAEHGVRDDDRADTPAGDEILGSAAIDDPEFQGQVIIPAHLDAEPDIAVVLRSGQRVRAVTELAHAHGAVGVVRALRDGWTGGQHQRLAQLVQTAAEEALAAVQRDLTAHASAAGAFLIRARAVLDYAARHLSLVATADDKVHPAVDRPLVEQVLGLPLFPSRFGGPIPAWRLIRRFCLLASVGQADATQRVLGDLANDAPQVLRDWVGRTLALANVIRPNHHGHETGPEAGHEANPAALVVERPDGFVDAELLCRNLEYWIAKLRPDRVKETTRVWISPTGPHEPFIDGGLAAVFLNSDHWLTRWAIEDSARDPEALAWILLAIYAHINAVLEPVTNVHELAFQRAIADAVTAGVLKVVAVPT